MIVRYKLLKGEEAVIDGKLAEALLEWFPEIKNVGSVKDRYASCLRGFLLGAMVWGDDKVHNDAAILAELLGQGRVLLYQDKSQ